MRHFFAWMLVATCFGTFLEPILAQSQSPKSQRNLATTADYKALAKSSSFLAKINGISPLAKSITVELTKSEAKENPNFDPIQAQREQLNLQQTLYRNQIRALSDPNPFNRMAAMRRVTQAQQRAMNPQNARFKMEKVALDYELPLSSSVKLRKSFLVEEFDDRGYLKKFTAKEIAALKSPGVPGYKASLEEVEPGQVAWIYVKPAPKSLEGSEMAGRPLVTMVLVTSPPQPFSSGGSSSSRKK